MALPFNFTGGAFFDLSARAKLRIFGADRFRFLNGQLTNDVRKGTSANAVASAVLNAKGKLDAYLFLSTDADSFVLDAASELREVLPSRLERYIIADDVEIEDITEQFSILHLLGDFSGIARTNCRTVSANRLGEPGLDLWIEKSNHREFCRNLSSTLPFCDENCAETFRIEQGVPRWGRELNNEIIPVEANLEENVIDYEKGCYIGQEVISRMKMSGQRSKRLCGLASLSAARLSPGMRLLAIGEEKKEVGWITSAAQSERLGKEIALAYVKRGFNQAGTKLDALSLDDRSAAEFARVEIVDLPFTGGRDGSG